jgi:hypothetical protein
MNPRHSSIRLDLRCGSRYSVLACDTLLLLTLFTLLRLTLFTFFLACGFPRRHRHLRCFRYVLYFLPIVRWSVRRLSARLYRRCIHNHVRRVLYACTRTRLIVTPVGPQGRERMRCKLSGRGITGRERRRRKLSRTHGAVDGACRLRWYTRRNLVILRCVLSRGGIHCR